MVLKLWPVSIRNEGLSYALDVGVERRVVIDAELLTNLPIGLLAEGDLLRFGDEAELFFAGDGVDGAAQGTQDQDCNSYPAFRSRACLLSRSRALKPVFSQSSEERREERNAFPQVLEAEVLVRAVLVVVVVDDGEKYGWCL